MKGTYAKMTMNKYVKDLVEDYKIYTRSDLKVQETTGAPGKTLSKSGLEEPDKINNYRSFVGQLMWYTTKGGPDVANGAMYLAVHMSHPRAEHWKELGHFIGYLKGKETRVIIIINPKVLKVFMFCYLNYATYKDTRKSVNVLVTTLGGTLLTCLSKTQSTMTLRST